MIDTPLQCIVGAWHCCRGDHRPGASWPTGHTGAAKQTVRSHSATLRPGLEPRTERSLSMILFTSKSLDEEEPAAAMVLGASEQCAGRHRRGRNGSPGDGRARRRRFSPQLQAPSPSRCTRQLLSGSAGSIATVRWTGLRLGSTDVPLNVCQTATLVRNRRFHEQAWPRTRRHESGHEDDELPHPPGRDGGETRRGLSACGIPARGRTCRSGPQTCNGWSHRGRGGSPRWP